MSASSIESYALLFHSCYLASANKRNTSVTSHSVTIEKDRFVVGAGRNLSTDDQARIANVLIESLDTELTMFPSNVLARSLDSIVWYRTAKKSLMRFLDDGEVTEIERPVPNLLFMLRKGKLHVACYKGKGRPKDTTLLYHAPFGNISSSTYMCVGENSLPPHPSLQDMHYVERMFFESEFSALHHNSLTGIDSWKGMINFWVSLKADQFDTSLLQIIRNNRFETLNVGRWIEKKHV